MRTEIQIAAATSLVLKMSIKTEYQQFEWTHCISLSLICNWLDEFFDPTIGTGHRS